MGYLTGKIQEPKLDILLMINGKQKIPLLRHGCYTRCNQKLVRVTWFSILRKKFGMQQLKFIPK